MIGSSNSQEINPWTVRQKKTPQLKEQPPSKRELQHQSLPLRKLNKGALHANQPLQKGLQLPLIRQTISLKSHHITSDQRIKQLDSLLSQDFYSKFLPNYKLINISFGNHTVQKTTSKKNVPYHIQSLRQYTGNREVIKKQDNSKTSQKTSNHKIVRYYSEQKEKDCEKIVILSRLEKQSSLQRRNTLKTREQKNNPTLKLINRSKTEQIAEKLPIDGELYKKLDTLCDLRCTLGNKLSLMKRTYNMKKIKKILT